MTWVLLLAIALLTAASRVLPMALLPVPRGRAAAILDALPAPLFASLAVLALLPGGEVPPAPVLLAAAAALLGAARRSLLVVVACGLGGFLLGTGLTA